MSKEEKRKIKPAKVSKTNSRDSYGRAAGEIRIEIAERVWFMSIDDAKAAFVGLAQYFAS